MNFTRLKTALVAVSVCATALFMSAGGAFANAGPQCTFGSSSGNTETCFAIAGPDGTVHVDNMEVSAEVFDSTRTLQVCIHGPAADLPFCTQFQPVAPGAAIELVWAPNRDVHAGTYCGRTWRQNDNGTAPTLIGEVCFDVHS